MSEKLYKRFSPDFDFSGIDHIIIGSGMGGLTVANWLAKAGKKVVVLERHYTPGGFTHSFNRKHGFKWDVGVHYVGNMNEGNNLRTLFDFVTNGRLKWQSMGPVYDVVHIGDKYYEFKAGKEAFRQQMKAYFPNDAEAIDVYLELIEKSNKSGSAFFFEKTFEPWLSKMLGWVFRNRYNKYSQRTTLDVLKDVTSNPQLRAVLCAQCGNYGLTPDQSSFAAHAMVVGHFMEGGYYPVGGTDNIGKYAIESLYKHGGELYIKAEVSRIVVKNRKVTGVQVGETFIPCKSVISNVGVNNTFNQLLDVDERIYCGYKPDDALPASAHMCLYVGLDRSDAELNLPAHNIWSFEHADFESIFKTISLKNAAQKFSYISFPSAKDPEWAGTHPNMATIQALTIGDYNWFKEFEYLPWMKRGAAYEQLKADFETTMLERLYTLFPQIKGHVVTTEVSTPLSTRHFANYKTGEIYGLTHTPARFKLPFLRPVTRIKGLRLVGQDITLVGLAGAMLSGMLCAITILKFGVWRLFRDMRKVPGEG